MEFNVPSVINLNTEELNTKTVGLSEINTYRSIVIK